MTTTDWAFCRRDLTEFGLGRIIDDYDNRAHTLPNRKGGPGAIGREDFAAGWISHAARSGAGVYLSDEGRSRLGCRKGHNQTSRRFPSGRYTAVVLNGVVVGATAIASGWPIIHRRLSAGLPMWQTLLWREFAFTQAWCARWC